MSTIDSINRRSTPVHCSYVMTLLLDPGPRPVCPQVRGEWRSLIQRGSEGAYLRPTGLYVADVWTYAIESRVGGPTWENHILGVAIREEVQRFGRPGNENCIGAAVVSCDQQ